MFMCLKSGIMMCISRMRGVVVCVWFCCTLIHCMAQQDPLFSQYQFNTLVINPAYAGTRGMMSLMALSRHQWIGFDGAPSTQTFTMHTPFSGSHVSLGFSIIHDKLIPVNQTGFYGDYAYSIRLSSNSNLSFGLKGGLNRIVTNMSALSPLPGSSDPAYSGGNESLLLPNFGFGIYLYHPHYFFGASVPKLLQNDLSSGGVNQSVLTGHEIRHYFVMGGFVMNVTDQLKLKPSLMMRVAEAAPLSVDLNLTAVCFDRLWIGGMYRQGSAFGGLIQMQFNEQWRIGYAVEYSINDLQQYNDGTHELMIGYEFSFKKSHIYNPRYF